MLLRIAELPEGNIWMDYQKNFDHSVRKTVLAQEILAKKSK